MWKFCNDVCVRTSTYVYVHYVCMCIHACVRACICVHLRMCVWCTCVYVRVGVLVFHVLKNLHTACGLCSTLVLTVCRARTVHCSPKVLLFFFFLFAFHDRSHTVARRGGKASWLQCVQVCPHHQQREHVSGLPRHHWQKGKFFVRNAYSRRIASRSPAHML